jgi:hypothetical protein
LLWWLDESLLGLEFEYGCNLTIGNQTGLLECRILAKQGIPEEKLHI